MDFLYCKYNRLVRNLTKLHSDSASLHSHCSYPIFFCWYSNSEDTVDSTPQVRVEDLTDRYYFPQQQSEGRFFVDYVLSAL